MYRSEKPKDGSKTDKTTHANKAVPRAEGLSTQWRIDTWFADLSLETRVQLKGLHAELLEANKSVNLISVKTIGQADAIHFADSILASKAIFNSGKFDEIFDFGSGNGFPGLVFAILYPKVKVHLVELDLRKAEYLKTAISKLKIVNADVMVRAIETLPNASVKVGMSRGLASISKSILMTRKVFARGGKYFHLKSEEWVSEISAIPTQLCSFWTPGLVSEYKLPVGEVKFAVVKTDKISD